MLVPKSNLKYVLGGAVLIGILIGVLLYIFIVRPDDTIPEVPEKGASGVVEPALDSVFAQLEKASVRVSELEDALRKSIQREREAAFRLKVLSIDPKPKVNVDSLVKEDALAEWLTKLSDENLHINEVSDIPTAPFK